MADADPGRRLRRHVVAGDSMYPVLRDGDEIDVALDAFARRAPRPGEIVLARHPFRRGMLIVKRVRDVAPDGSVFVVGEDPVGSSDSRGFGRLPREAVLGLVVLPTGPPETR